MPKLKSLLVLGSCLAVCILLAAGFERVLARNRAAGTPPDIIFILTDDQRLDTFQPQFMPQTFAHIVDNGRLYTEAYVTTPLCCPSRASILTGLYGHNHGVLGNTHGPGGVEDPTGATAAFRDVRSLATELDAYGYYTALYGKYLNEYDVFVDAVGADYIPPGWDDWFVFVRNLNPNTGWFYRDYQVNDNGVLVDRTNGEADYSTDVIFNRAVERIHTVDDPLFLFISTWAPHTRPEPAERHLRLFNGASFPRNANYGYVDEPLAPPHMWGLPEPDEEAADFIWQRQLETLLAVDEGVAAVFDALAVTGRLQNALVIFMSDNGYLLGEHRWFGKRVPYDESIRVPLAIRYGSADMGAPQQIDAFALNIDIPLTIADYVGIQIPPGLAARLNGRSLLAIDDTWRDAVLLEHWPVDADGPVGYTGIRTIDWKYVEYDEGALELFNMVLDPGEVVNLAYDPDYALIRDSLAAQLEALRNE